MLEPAAGRTADAAPQMAPEYPGDLTVPQNGAEGRAISERLPDA